MTKFTYEQIYQDWEEFITDFYLDVMNSEGFNDLNGFLIDYKTDLGSKIWITTPEGETLCIGYIQWDDDENIFMEYEMFRETPVGLVKMRKDSE
jgi:hypothetical protein